jgi:diguanylate cyclase (GGDEF)-like protein
LISKVARRIFEAVQRDDSVARVGGDEFVVLTNVSDQHELAALAHTLEDAISAEPV